MTEEVGGNDALVTARQARKAAREAKRQEKDAKFEARLARKHSKDLHYFRGHQVVDTAGLGAAFPEHESPEFHPAKVRRNVLHGVVLVVLAALVVAGLVVAGMVLRGELELHLNLPKAAEPVAVCPTEVLKYPSHRNVSVNVYNASSVEGLAGKVAKELKKRGFKVLAVGNTEAKANAGVIVVSGKDGHVPAYGLQQNFLDSVYLQDKRETNVVDIVLTGNYTRMVAAKKVDMKAGTLQCPAPDPQPEDTGAAVATPTAKPAKG